MTPDRSEPEAAAYVGKSLASLRRYRQGGTGPRFYRIGHSVRYKTEDLDTWLEARAVQPGAPLAAIGGAS